MRLSPVLAGLLLALLWTPQSTAAEYVDIREWEVPWSESGLRDPFVEPSGRVLFVGQRGHYGASLNPESGEFERYELDPGTGPHNLTVAGDGTDAIVWSADNLMSHIGRLDPRTGAIRDTTPRRRYNR